MSTNGVWRTQPMYTFSEAAHLASVSTTTVRNWVLGYVSRDRKVEPLFSPHAQQGPMVSFLQMVEIVVAGRFRKALRIPFGKIRGAYVFSQNEFKLEYPFAHLRLEALGGHVVHRMNEERPGTSLQALDEPGQWSLPGLVLEVVNQLDYERDLAARWYPAGKEIPIVVDPRISVGLPTVSTRGITVQAVRKRFKAGQLTSFIAQDLALDDVVVQRVLQYADQVAA